MKTENKKRHVRTLIAIIFLVVSTSLWWVQRAPNGDNTTRLFLINPGQSVKSIGAALYNQGFIRNKTLFYIRVRIKGIISPLKAGAFKLTTSQTLPEIIDALETQNGTANQVKVTIPEGLSLSEIATTLEENSIISANRFLNYVQTASKESLEKKYPFLSECPTQNLEGYLFPDTYKILPGQTSALILEHFLREFNNKIWSIWKNTPHGTTLTFHQTLTLASLVEKEAISEAEMGTIAGVFYNRLQKRILLGSDPTVAYALNEPRKKWIYLKDLKIDSPYNTYKYRGLPPTPIASPGVKAFEAALNPEKTDYLYFVSNQDGTHSFTTNFKDHIKMKNKIKKQLKKSKNNPFSQ